MKKKEKLLSRFLSFLSRQGVEMSVVRETGAEGECGMFVLKPKEQRNLARLYLTKKRK